MYSHPFPQKNRGREGEGLKVPNETVFLRYVFHGVSYCVTTASTALANSPLPGGLR